MKKLLVIASLLSLSAVGVAHAAGDAAAGAGKTALCAGCHMADGNSVAPNFPKIAGQHAGYIVKQLTEFKSGVRVDPTMVAMVAALNEQDMADVAAYFASQKIAVGEAAAGQVAAGQSIYRGGNAAAGVSACVACHGPAGAGNPQGGFPQLGGQHADYTASQLKRFRAGERNNDASSMMRNIAAKMSDAEINAVAQYIQGLH